MRNPFPKKKSKLPPLGKALIAAKVVLDVRDEKLEAEEAGALLRQTVGLNWSLITAAQYLTGKEGTGAIEQLPPDWAEDGRTKRDLVEAVFIAHLFCAQGHSKGAQLSAGLNVPAFKADGEIGKLLREVQAELEAKGSRGGG